MQGFLLGLKTIMEGWAEILGIPNDSQIFQKFLWVRVLYHIF